jgi:hypothetical protein
MAQNVGQSRGSQKHKQFVQDSANSYIVDAFKDMSLTAPGSPVDGEGYIVENVGSIDPSWGTITGLADGDIIRWRQSKLEWQIVMKAVVDNQGFKAFVKEEDTLYVVDSGAEWIVASGSGGGVKNFAQKQAGAYKPGDWIQGNSGIFGAAGTLAGALEVETVAPLDGKKSFKYTTAAGSGDDWFYLLVDIDQYARGGVIAFTFDYQWDGDEDIQVQIWDPTFTNQYSTELNLVKNTENDNKLSRNSRTIYAHPDTESQVVVGFQVNTNEASGKTFIWDNLKVTDDIGVIGSSAELQYPSEIKLRATNFTGTGIIPECTFTNLVPGKKYMINGQVVGSWDDSSTDHPWIFQAAIQDGNGNNLQVATERDYRTVIGISTLTFNRVITAESNEVRINVLTNPDFVNGSSTTPTTYLEVTELPEDGNSGRFLQVPNGEKLRDTFSAVVNNAAATISETGGIGYWIQNISKGGTGIYNISFVPGIFSTPPAIQATVNHVSSSQTVHCAVWGVTTSGCTLSTAAWNVAGDFIDRGFAITAQKQESVPDIVGVPVSIQGQTHEQDTSVEAQNFGGYTAAFGASNVHTFTNLQANVGSAVSWINNTYFQINETGLYHISANAAHVSSVNWGIFKNAFVTADGIARGSGTAETTGDSASATRWLNAGDILFVASGNPISSSNDAMWSFTCAKVGTQPLIDGGLVESPGYTVRVGGTPVNSTNHNRIPTWPTVFEDNTANGAAANFKYVKDAANGDYFEVLEDGFFHVGLTLGDQASSGQEFAIVRNLTDAEDVQALSTLMINVPEKVLSVSRSGQAANANMFCGYTGRLNKGDIIRAHNNTANISISNESRFTMSQYGQTVKYSSRVYKEDPIAWQKKTLTSTLTGYNGVINILTFNNLEVGKTYRISGTVALRSNTAGSDNIDIIFHPTATLVNTTEYGRQTACPAASGLIDRKSPNIIFTATSDTLYVHSSSVEGGSQIYGTGNNDGTYIILEELPFHAQTTKWS